MHPDPANIPRESKEARPWNDHSVLVAGQTYGIRDFKSMSDVQKYENALISKSILHPDDRISCDGPGCGVARKDGKHNHGEQGLLF
jgi:hypothetical protein